MMLNNLLYDFLQAHAKYLNCIGIACLYLAAKTVEEDCVSTDLRSYRPVFGNQFTSCILKCEVQNLVLYYYSLWMVLFICWFCMLINYGLNNKSIGPRFDRLAVWLTRPWLINSLLCFICSWSQTRWCWFATANVVVLLLRCCAWSVVSSASLNGIWDFQRLLIFFTWYALFETDWQYESICLLWS